MAKIKKGMNNKRRLFILLQMLDQIQQGNKGIRDGINKSVVTI